MESVARDRSGNGLDATCTFATCPVRVAGPQGLGLARSFDGSHAFLLASPLLRGEAGFTVFAWFQWQGGTTALAKPQLAGVGATWEVVIN
ncbi:MAG: hypothetical protein ACKV2T_27065, partial [Kofleriaceae bacterium]